MKSATLAASVLALAVVVTGCKAKTNAKDAKPVAEPKPQISLDESVADAVRNGLPDPAERLSLATVYFELDQATLTEEAKAALAQNAQVLTGHPDVTVRIEGHCDERGSTQYNLGLGERRANAVREYLAGLGVTTARMEIVSYGEERAAVAAHGEEAWAKNRRAELLVTKGAERVSSSYGARTE